MSFPSWKLSRWSRCRARRLWSLGSLFHVEIAGLAQADGTSMGSGKEVPQWSTDVCLCLWAGKVFGCGRESGHEKCSQDLPPLPLEALYPQLPLLIGASANERMS